MSRGRMEEDFYEMTTGKGRANKRKSKRGVTKKKRYYTKQKEERNSFPKRIPVICAPMQLVKLKYIESTTTGILFSSANYVGLTYYINDIYDFYAGSASKALAGYGAWTSLYYNWRVVSAKVNVQFCNTTSAQSMYAGVVFGQPGNTFSTLFTTWTAMMNATENQLNYSTMLAPVGTTGAMKEIEFAINPKNCIGDPRMYSTDITYVGSVSASPNARIPMFVYGATNTSATITASINMRLVVEFCVKFFNRKINQN